MYEYAMATAIEYTLFRPMVKDKADILVATGNNDRQSDDIFDNHTYVETGRKITNGCAWTYKNAPNGIMPELFTMESCPTLSECDYVPKSCSNSGSSPFSSVLHAWEMFQAVDNNTRMEFANAAIRDVMKSPPEKDDSMESFWMAETLKYFHLILSEPSLVSLDDFVFNTEAHPFRIPS
ncbi:glycoside hydrolase family 47 protein [Macroventuria anomochaeta]|uniref:Glycoside hydrolase family 47 protein n=1 Tax=Macroventuria anomochaeta TaxID=301207 RepID=A0ACB6RNN1_9PLEO|nr:glycoside hydrolase family 47 protein [Macroventuria anomochaeta]KAF2622917.1 glycoside hydrolase family 47 protein [Macroventuria anomochaeta]